ncbi:MAG: hypothetical protein GTN76_09465 [Candidatus Aenigmarchaeota archaeon]|nr:hypothetical protein [Candidatus Aenigmarchaeota archaeon]
MDDYEKELLGERLPGSEKERAVLLKYLHALVQRNGKTWVKKHRNLLLSQAEYLLNLGLPNLS